MFSKNKSETAKVTNGKSVKPAVPSIISQDLVVKGDLISEGEIQIDGIIHGDINTSTLLVGETAEVNGEINAKRVRVYGRVNGQITAQSVMLASSAQVSGNIIHEDLSIDKGAFLEGHCQRIAEQQVEASAPGAISGKMDSASSISSSGKIRDVTPPVPTKPHAGGSKENAAGLNKLERPSNGSDKVVSA